MRLGGLLARLLAVVLGLYAYCLTLGRFDLRVRPSQLATEMPLVLVLYYLLRAFLRPGLVSDLAAAAPLFALYGLHDYHYRVFATLPDLSDFRAAPNLVHVFPWYETLILGTASAALVAFWAWRVDVAALAGLPRRVRFTSVVGMVVLASVVGMAVTPVAITTATAFLVPYRVGWAPHQDVERFGRLFMAIVRDAERRVLARSLATYRTPEETGLALDAGVRSSIERRSVHLILLESFIDPRRFRKIRFNPDPIAPEFTNLVGENLSTSFSPSFGGYSARTEFEVLCGVPSFEIAGALDFYAFSGAPTVCLPAILGNLGFRTLASFAGTSQFYNLIRAYESVGFQRSFFGNAVPGGAGRILWNDWRGLLFDQFLFDQNLAMVEEELRAGRPLFNYVFTIYGHMPFEIDTRYQPMIIAVDGADETVLRIANQTYYRTRALAKYLERLREIDPTGLVIVLGDHLPPLPAGVAAYRDLGYRAEINGSAPDGLHETMLIVMDRGVPEKAGPVCDFEVPALVLEKLSGGRYCEMRGGCEPSCSTKPERPIRYLEAYKTIIGLGSRLHSQ